MIETFRAHRFRCFRDFQLQALRRVNLLTGFNNAGKTSLLEAVFLHVGANNPGLALSLNKRRGLSQLPADDEELWGWLFYQRDTSTPIQLSSSGTRRKDRQLQVSLQDRKTPMSTGGIPTAGTSGTSGMLAPPDLRAITIPRFAKDIEFKFSEDDSQPVVSRAWLTAEGKLELDAGQLPYVPTGGFLSPSESFPSEDADRFSQLERDGRQDLVLESMRKMEPRLERLAVLTQGGIPRVHAQLCGHRRLIPVGLMGGGFSRLLSMLLLVTCSPEGVVLVDELENGLHHLTLIKAWRAVLEAAAHSNCQIFATTHSRECLMAAFAVEQERSANEVSLHRLQWIEDQIEAVRLEARHIELAAEMNLEVRS